MNRIPEAPPMLHSGDRLTQEEFHRRYQACPEDVKFELIGGIVYMASPLRIPHGDFHSSLNCILRLYHIHTPGSQLLDNATAILGEESEPQPDLLLRILPEYGGQSRTRPDQYVEGAPELVAEVAHSRVAIDLHQKQDDYRAAGVREYVVLAVEEQAFHWFDLARGKALRAGRDGTYRSRVFPGLWLDADAFVARDELRVIEVLQEGLASPEHGRFVRRLAREQKRLAREG